MGREGKKRRIKRVREEDVGVQIMTVLERIQEEREEGGRKEEMGVT